MGWECFVGFGTLNLIVEWVGGQVQVRLLGDCHGQQHKLPAPPRGLSFKVVGYLDFAEVCDDFNGDVLLAIHLKTMHHTWARHHQLNCMATQERATDCRGESNHV